MNSASVTGAAPHILAKVQAAKKVLLHCHPSPDPDSVGSALGMMHALKLLGKDVTVIAGDSVLPKEFGGFTGYADIVKKNFGEIDQQEFDLFLSQDAGSIEMISRKAPVVFSPHLTVIVIDHHVTNTRYGHINLVVPEYAATAEIVHDLLAAWRVALNHDIALNLYLGMYADTGGFKYPATTSHTLNCAAACVKMAPDFHEVIFQMHNASSPAKLKFLAKALGSIETRCDGKLAIASMSREDILATGIAMEEVGNHDVVNFIRSVEGYDIAVSMTEEEEGTVKMSLRTRDAEKYDVSKMAAALGGGGHRAAAGASVKGNITEAKAKLEDVVARYLTGAL